MPRKRIEICLNKEQTKKFDQKLKEYSKIQNDNRKQLLENFRLLGINLDDNGKPKK